MNPMLYHHPGPQNVAIGSKRNLVWFLLAAGAHDYCLNPRNGLNGKVRARGQLPKNEAGVGTPSFFFRAVRSSRLPHRHFFILLLRCVQGIQVPINNTLARISRGTSLFPSRQTRSMLIRSALCVSLTALCSAHSPQRQLRQVSRNAVIVYRYSLFLWTCTNVLYSFCSRFDTQQQQQQELIVGYEPLTQVTDHAAIDLDQKKIAERVGLGDFAHALRVYREGGHSKSYAQLTLLAPTPNKSYKKGTQVVGLTDVGGDVSGALLEDMSWTTEAAVVLQVQYRTGDVQEKYVDCQVGALFAFSEANRKGCKFSWCIFGCLVPRSVASLSHNICKSCYSPPSGTGFAGSGAIELISLGTSQTVDKYNYTYDQRHDNKNARTLQGFSTTAVDKMKSAITGQYYPDFATFLDYYGDTDYADKWVMAAASGNSTNFSTDKGNADFAPLVGNGGRGRAYGFSKGTLYLHVFMYVIRELEDAVDDCRRACDISVVDGCNNDAVSALDEAVAFYAGSSEGPDGSGDGTLLYDHADKEALDFKTAGYLSDEVTGTAFINLEIVYWFKNMKKALLSTNPDGTGQCDAAEEIKTFIVNLMKVPLIQGALRYAWNREALGIDGPGAEKAQAEGATLAAAVLPFVHECDRAHANTIYNELNLASTDVDFSRVKSAFEQTYSCLNITCVQVGGLWNGQEYEDGAEPCQDGWGVIDRSPHSVNSDGSATVASGGGSDSVNPSSGNGSEDDSNPNTLVFGLFLAVLLSIVLLFVVWLRFCKRGGRKSKAPERNDTNIAAVSAVEDVDLT